MATFYGILQALAIHFVEIPRGYVPGRPPWEGYFKAQDPGQKIHMLA